MNAYFNMYLGTELKDKLDETFFSMLPSSSDAGNGSSWLMVGT